MLCSCSWSLSLPLEHQKFPRVIKITMFDPLSRYRKAVTNMTWYLHLPLQIATLLKLRRYSTNESLSSIQQEQRKFLAAFKAKKTFLVFQLGVKLLIPWAFTPVSKCFFINLLSLASYPKSNNQESQWIFTGTCLVLKMKFQRKNQIGCVSWIRLSLY